MLQRISSLRAGLSPDTPVLTTSTPAAVEAASKNPEMDRVTEAALGSVATASTISPADTEPAEAAIAG